MECKQANRLIKSYISGELESGLTEEFLEHIESCKNCREELEIYYIIEKGLGEDNAGKENEAKSAGDYGVFNISGALEDAIRESYRKIEVIKLGKTAMYSLNTLIAISVLITLLLRIRMWL